MYRTDKQFMKDPATAHARIYIGNIAESVVAENLEQKFRAHGKILGLVLQRGFGFIQYENEFQAKQAQQNEHGVMFHGRKLNVRQAFAQGQQNKQFQQQHPYPQQHYQQQQNYKQQEQQQQNYKQQEQQQQPPNFKKQEQQQNFKQQEQQQQQNFQQQEQQQQQQHQHHGGQNVGQQPQNIDRVREDEREAPPPPQVQQEPQDVQDDPPLQQNQTHNSPPPQQQQQRQHLQSQQQQPPPQQQQQQQQQPQQQASQPPPPKKSPPPHQSHHLQDDMHQEFGSGPVLDKRGSRKGKRRSIGRDRELDRHGLPMNYRNAPYYGRNDSYAPGYIPPIVETVPERNDCEIIVVSKALTEYAEYIEQRLKALGLIVDLLFPNEDVPIGRVLANISSRGCLYAILIMPQNEEHRSLTLDILHGIPQEHRNMPIEDALLLITRNFDAYMRGEQTGENANGTGVNLLSDRHPENIQMLLNLLAENRQITTAQYDRLIKYLLQRRDLQSQHEVAEGGDSNQEEPTSKQAELQSRILNILNKSNEDVKPVTSATTTATPTPLLNDPSVQKALDSLLLGDMFKSIGSTA